MKLYNYELFRQYVHPLQDGIGSISREGDGRYFGRSVNTENFVLLFKSTKQYSDPDYTLCRKYMYTCAMHVLAKVNHVLFLP